MSETRFLASSIELECPTCNTDDPADFRDCCEDPWHAEAAALLADEAGHDDPA